MDNAWHQRPDVVGTSERPPSEYTDRFYVDTVVFDDHTLRFLVDRMGVDQVLRRQRLPLSARRGAGRRRVVRDNPLLTEDRADRDLSTNARDLPGLGPTTKAVPIPIEEHSA